jgi:hypothetical protein
MCPGTKIKILSIRIRKPILFYFVFLRGKAQRRQRRSLLMRGLSTAPAEG